MTKTALELVETLRSVGGTFDGAASEFVTCAEAADAIETNWRAHCAAMLLLAEVEPYVDEWNFPITLGERIKAACDAHFGHEVRPSL